MARLWAPVGLLLVIAFGGAAALGGEPGCLGDWSAAAPVVKAEGLATVEQLSARARDKLGGDIVKATLCAEAGGYVYRLVVRTAGGQLKTVAVDARAPFDR